MSNLFNRNELKTKLAELSLEAIKVKKAQEIFSRWFHQVDTTREEENQQSFLQEFFGQILDYQAITGAKDNSLWWESGSIVDGTKPDGILGFNLKSYKSDKTKSRNVESINDLENYGDIRCVIELKDSSVDLDKKQNRKSFLGTPIEQAFSYASKVGGNCEFVIVSNFIETRLYLASDQSKYHVFYL